MAPKFVQLDEVQPQQTRWLWPNRIPYGSLTVMVGIAGAGKSTLACDIAARVSSGRPMFNCQVGPEPHGVVLLSAEDDLAGATKERLLAAGAQTRFIRALDCSTGGLSLPADLVEIERQVADVQARLIILDPLMEFVEGNANSDESIRRALRPLVQLARRTGAAVVIVHHPRKSTAGPALYAAAGTVGLVALARSTLLVAQLPGGDNSVLAAIKNSYGPLSASLAFKKVNRNGAAAIEWLGTSDYSADELISARGGDEGSALREAIEVLFAILGEGEVLAKEAKQLAMDAGVSAPTLKRAKKALGVTSKRVGFGPGSQFFWHLEDNPLVRQLLEGELSDLADGLFYGPDDEEDPADWWRRP